MMDEQMTQRVLAELDRRGLFDQGPDVTVSPEVRRHVARDTFTGQSTALRLAMDDLVEAMKPGMVAAGRRLSAIIARLGRR